MRYIKDNEFRYYRNIEYQNMLDKKTKGLKCLMDDSKWFKLFEAFEKKLANTLKVKFLINYKNRNVMTLTNGFFTNGNGIRYISGAFSYKEIEWVKIFETTDVFWEKRFEDGTKLKTYNLEELAYLINNIGKFEYKEDVDGIIIYGYKK